MTTNESYREIVDFLIVPKNLENAFDLVDVLPIALDRLHTKFWDTLKSKVETKVDEGQEQWVVKLVTDERDNAEGIDFLKPGYSYLEVSPSASDEMPIYCCFWIEQEYRTSVRKQASGDYAELVYGLGFSQHLTKKQRANLPKEAQTLIKQIGDDWISYRDQLGDGWLARKKLDYKLRARYESIRLAQGDSLEDDVSTAFQKLFDERRDALNKINTALRKAGARFN